MDYKNLINEYLKKEIETIQALDIDSINAAMNLITAAFEAEKNIYIFGNGGSAATAFHFQNDFNMGLSEKTSKKFRFQCLNNNTAAITAVANDFGYDEIFRFQLNGRLEEGDLVIPISASGNSANILNAAEYAKTQGNKIIGITGFDGGKLKKLCDVSLHAPVNSMQITEDIHLIFNHLIMAVLYKTLCGIDHLKE